MREIQRALKISSPSLVIYHLAKLEDAGFLKRENGNYVIGKILLDGSIRISHFLVPKYLFYFILTSSILILELTVLRPLTLYREYFFSTVSMFIVVLIFFYETAKEWIRRNF